MPRKGSGITSIAKLRARCRVDGQTGCWHWKEGFHPRGEPRVYLASVGQAVSGARAAVILSGRTPGPRNWMDCQCSDCVNPAHAIAGTAAEWGAWYREREIWTGSARRIAAVRASGRARSGLTLAVVREIRATEGEITSLEWSRRLGCSDGYASRIRVGDRWAETSPFEGLLK